MISGLERGSERSPREVSWTEETYSGIGTVIRGMLGIGWSRIIKSVEGVLDRAGHQQVNT